MKLFLNKEFLLDNATGAELFHNYAEKMPIFDYHCHINPKEIADDKKYENITQVWLYGDHYKWRAMRANGVEEKYITGSASDYERFLKWAETMPYIIGNPLYVWSHLELQRYFGIEKQLNPETADEIWNRCNELLKGNFSTREIIKRSNVKIICTTDNPVDSLEYHKIIKEAKDFDVKVLPAFRPDVFINIELPEFSSWVEKLSKVAEKSISTFDEFIDAFKSRITFFHENGCRLSDHALDPIVCSATSEAEASSTFKDVMSGKAISNESAEKFKTFMLLLCGTEYARLGWTMQLHLSCIRNVNSRMMKALGRDTGFDAVGSYPFAPALVKLFDTLNSSDSLPKTVLYSLNHNDYEALFTIGSCFQGGVPGKIQLGSPWWFNDHKDGIEKQLRSLTNLGLLSRFVGMLTDSRSFISYPRHEYFRRILCNLIGDWVEKGEIPADMALLGKMVENISYNNAINYFKVD